MKTISKTLSANDIGKTGGHQAGILIPRDPRILGFFPILSAKTYNPRCLINFTDEADEKQEFSFIYYNNKLFDGTRNEYRLTRMTKYLRDSKVAVGDEVVFTRTDNDEYSVSCKKNSRTSLIEEGVLRLDAGWKIINF